MHSSEAVLYICLIPVSTTAAIYSWLKTQSIILSFSEVSIYKEQPIKDVLLSIKYSPERGLWKFVAWSFTQAEVSLDF